MTTIKKIIGYEILSSGGDPTVEATVFLSNGISASASVPFGASDGTHEAFILLDKDPRRYRGKGMLKAAKNISTTLSNLLKGKSLRIAASSSSEVEIEAEYETMHLEATSTGEISIKGKTLKLETSASSASEIDASDLLANEVFAQATSASETTVHAILKLDAKASSASQIHSVKKPREVRKEETSAGQVSIE